MLFALWVGVVSASSDLEKRVSELERENAALASEVTRLRQRRQLQTCEDTDGWYKKDVPSKDCDWVGEFAAARCGTAKGTEGTRGWDGTSASEACAYTCGTCSTLGKEYMEEIAWDDYDSTPSSYHWEDGSTSFWTEEVIAARAFRETPSGGNYSYRNKVLMGMAQTRILNEPPSATPKDEVEFDIPENVTRPATDEEIMMLSVLEMQALLRQGDLTATELTTIALAMLEKYDPEFNMLEVSLTDLAMEIAAQADEKFAAGTYDSPIQGIPFAIKDTYDVDGYATAYGSWEFMNNVVMGSESPLVTYAVEAGAVPLFKSTVPQLTWGYANWNGTVYSCLNGGFAAGAGSSGGSSIGSANAVCLGVVPVAICEQTGSSCQAPAIANGISTLIPGIGTFSREGNGLYSMDSDRPGLLCRDIMSCIVFYNYMRGASDGDPQSRDVPFVDPSKEDISTYTIGFLDNSYTTAWPEAWDTPLQGQRTNVYDALVAAGADVTEYESFEDMLGPKPQLITDYETAGIGNGEWFAWFDWYWLNVEGFFEDIFHYGGSTGSAYGPVWVGQNFNFDNGHHKHHIGATAYGYLESLWLHGYVSEVGMYPWLETLPDVVVHFAQSELGATIQTGMVKRAGITTVHIPEFYWNTTDPAFDDWDGSRPIDYYPETTVSAAMITCESKKYEPWKAMAVCLHLQNTLVEGGKLISPYIDVIHQAIKSGEHDLNCPYDWSAKKSDYLDGYPDEVRAKVEASLSNIGTLRTCATVEGGCEGGTCSDIRLKHNVARLGASPSGIPIYRFSYRPRVGLDGDFVGAMAQDLLDLAPDAVCVAKDGFYRVDYSMIDVDFRRA